MTITAQVIADSISESGTRITTFEIEVPRIIWSEFMTHRVFSRNAASSRAIPVETFIKLIDVNPAMPSHWGQNQSGMQAKGEVDDPNLAEALWVNASKDAIKSAQAMHKIGLHKQVANRPLEPYQHMKAVVTSTTYDNWFWLRNHEDADPTIHALANTMLAAYTDSTPRLLLAGEWHMPYYFDGFWSEHSNGKDIHGFTLDEALKISSSCTAQVSYRKLDDSLEKATMVYGRLVDSSPPHFSPTEHQASPMEVSNWRIDEGSWEDGVTHMDRTGDLWSGNFKGWIQHRQLIMNNIGMTPMTSYPYLE